MDNISSKRFSRLLVKRCWKGGFSHAFWFSMRCGVTSLLAGFASKKQKGNQENLTRSNGSRLAHKLENWLQVSEKESLSRSLRFLNSSLPRSSIRFSLSVQPQLTEENSCYL